MLDVIFSLIIPKNSKESLDFAEEENEKSLRFDRRRQNINFS